MTRRRIDIIAVNDTLEPLDSWAHQCHAASIHLVKSGVLGKPARVARGSCRGVPGQHSWVVLGDDCYAKDAQIVDPTLWSYDDEVHGVWIGGARDGRHKPHGSGSIWQWGKPAHQGGPDLELDEDGLSPQALQFLDMVGPLDLKGWAHLAHAPVEGWPAAEIIAKMYHTPQLKALVPIDIVGMLTDINPEGLYL